MRTEVITVTPEYAAELLRLNTHNRTITRSRVEDIKRWIRTGQWKLTHQGIAIGPDGAIEDGQHRLIAISEGDSAVQLMVTWLDETVFDVIDTMRPRSPRDTLALAGVTNANRLPAAVRLVTHYRGDARDQIMGGGSGPRLSNRDQLDAVAANPEFEKWVRPCELAAKLVGRIGLTTPLLAAMVVIDQDVDGLDDSKREFISRIGEPVMLNRDSPIMALRRWFVASLDSVASQRRSQTAMYATIRAWNAYVEGRALHRVQGATIERYGAPTVSTGPNDNLAEE